MCCGQSLLPMLVQGRRTIEMADTHNSQSSSSAYAAPTFYFTTPPEAVNRILGTLIGAMWVSGAAVFISLLVGLGCYIKIADLDKLYQKENMNFGLWVDYTNELKGELVAHGIPTPPNPCTSKGACP